MINLTKFTSFFSAQPTTKVQKTNSVDNSQKLKYRDTAVGMFLCTGVCSVFLSYVVVDRLDWKWVLGPTSAVTLMAVGVQAVVGSQETNSATIAKQLESANRNAANLSKSLELSVERNSNLEKLNIDLGQTINNFTKELSATRRESSDTRNSVVGLSSLLRQIGEESSTTPTTTADVYTNEVGVTPVPLVNDLFKSDKTVFAESTVTSKLEDIDKDW